ncbi:MAG: hypothetical protein P8M16_10040 [Acidimicrobiales bacterium]|nr:hypothetical protein [Acidimicrobiales bacterium]
MVVQMVGKNGRGPVGVLAPTAAQGETLVPKGDLDRVANVGMTRVPGVMAVSSALIPREVMTGAEDGLPVIARIVEGGDLMLRGRLVGVA